jgi:polyphenol oxidase
MDTATALTWIQPDWPAPPGVHAAFTLRQGGFSTDAYASFNLALHCGDDPAHVTANRALLQHALKLPHAPLWLEQVHGARVVDVATARHDARADGIYTVTPGEVCAVMTADCLPVLFCSRDGNKIAAAHAGWRGLATGILEATVACLDPHDLLAWLGPAICPQCFEVGAEVRAVFEAFDPAASAAFTPSRRDHYLCDIYLLARQRLQNVGVHAIYGGSDCTYHTSEHFYSYRRDRVCGRMAALIWRDSLR